MMSLGKIQLAPVQSFARLISQPYIVQGPYLYNDIIQHYPTFENFRTFRPQN